MANITGEDTVTTSAVFVPENWSDLVLHFRQAKLQAAAFFENRTSDANFGDKVNFPLVSYEAATTFTEGETLLDKLSQNTETDIQLTIDQYATRPFFVSDLLNKQSQYDKKAIGFKTAGYSVAKAVDSAILADSANYTNDAINAAGTALTNLDITQAQYVLDALDVPEEDRAWFFHPVVIRDFLDLTGNYFTSLDFTSAKGIASGKIPGEVGMLLGSPVYKTTNVPTGTTGSPAATYYKNVYAHKQATGVVMQWAPMTQEEYIMDRQGTLCNVRSLYGIKTLRPTNGVILNR